MRAIIVLLSAFLAFPVQAKIVGKVVEDNGNVLLFDTPCTLANQGFHLELRNKANKVTLTGCWLEHNDLVYLIGENGARLVFPRDRFNWDVGD